MRGACCEPQDASQRCAGPVVGVREALFSQFPDMERREAPAACEAAQASLAIGRLRAPRTAGFAKALPPGDGTGLRGPSRGARASCGGFARPAAETLRLPALHCGLGPARLLACDRRAALSEARTLPRQRGTEYGPMIGSSQANIALQCISLRSYTDLLSSTAHTTLVECYI